MINQAPAEIVKREEHVEYRDQDGNVLDEEQVKALEGQVEFHTRYETKTHIVDADGVEFPEDAVFEDEMAPDPDVHTQ